MKIYVEVGGAHPSNIAKDGAARAGKPVTKQIEEFTDVYSFLFGSWGRGKKIVCLPVRA